MSLVNIEPHEGRQTHKLIISNTACKLLMVSSADNMGTKERLSLAQPRQVGGLPEEKLPNREGPELARTVENEG